MYYHDLRINGDRLRQSLEEMAHIGATPGGGVKRLALSDEDRLARDLFIQWLKDLRLHVTIDEMGNIFGRRAGTYDHLPPVLSGSHIDSQPKGGRFDGILGVMGALECLRTMEEMHITTDRPLVIVNWTNEEGCRFAPSMSSSGVWAGALDRDRVYNQTDLSGRRFVDELERIGYRGTAAARHEPLHAYYELHIEQGPVLEREKRTIGIPKGIVCVHWYDIHIEGEANQVGPTPMKGRHDALCTAAEMILRVDDLPRKMGGNLVATVGEIHNHPNSRNIIPDGVHFTVDIRSWDDALALHAWDDLRDDLEGIAAARGCPLRIEETCRVRHAPFDEKLMDRLADAADMLGYTKLHMVSGAGHDAIYINQIAPTAMIFVPSVGGRSHVEVEETSWQDCEAGTNVLLHCLLQSAHNR